MQNPKNLTQEELVIIVTTIQDLMYLDLVDNEDTYNPQKELNTSDLSMHIGELFAKYDLTPENCETRLQTEEKAAKLHQPTPGESIMLTIYRTSDGNGIIIESDENSQAIAAEILHYGSGTPDTTSVEETGFTVARDDLTEAQLYHLKKHGWCPEDDDDALLTWYGMPTD